MGCCSSTPTAPDVILPDPSESESCTFSLLKSGMFGGDYVAYKDEGTDDETKKWQFVNKTGSIWGGDAVIDIENFVRGGNPDKPKQGEISWHCQFDSTPTFEKQHKSPSTGFSRFVANFTNGAIDFDGEEPGDEVYFQRGGWGMNDGGNRRVMKWKLETQATIKSGGTRGQSYGPDGFVMDVFARGTSIADYDWENGQDGEEGHWRKQEKEFVDHLCFQIKQVNTGNVIALWGVPGDLDKNGGGADGDLVTIQNALFHMSINGGWFSSKPVIKTANGWDPLFALMVAYLCAYEYSPSAIKKDLNSDFPSDPNGWPGWG